MVAIYFNASILAPVDRVRRVECLAPKSKKQERKENQSSPFSDLLQRELHRNHSDKPGGYDASA
ncbi:MAG: hypothetical protein PUB98_10415 [Clostridiales bacterium]|nr:hypothetical protein [Clostridiales bacterium]